MAKKKVKTAKNVTFDAIKFMQDKFEIYLFAANASTLWNIVEINQREDEKDVGYQRALSKSRVRSIANFIENGNSIPLNILVSFDSATYRDGKLIVPNEPDSGWIIDGQHRLAGSHEAEKEILLPVVAFIGLSVEEQISAFVTINKEQKGVPTSLYLDLLKKLPNKKSEAERLKERSADLADRMKIDEESAFYNRIVVVTSPKIGQLSLTNFVRKVSPLLAQGRRFYTLPDEDRQGVLDNYYLALAKVFPKEYKSNVFFKTLGFGALLNALPTFLDITLQNQKGFRVSDAVKTWRTVDFFDFANWTGSGNAAEILYGNDLIEELTSANNVATNGSTIKLK